MALARLIDEIIVEALAQARTSNVRVYTFALDFDHESPAISACIDTEESSDMSVRQSNAYSMKYFRIALEARDWKQAALWRANTGRSFSLGDFAMINLVRTEIDPPKDMGAMFIALAEGIWRHQDAIAAQALSTDKLMYCCSGPNDEVDLVWSALPSGLSD